MKSERNFLMSVFFSRFGDSLSFLAFMMAFLNLSDSNTYVSLFLVLKYLPSILVSSAIGKTLDQRDRRKSLMWASLASAAVAGFAGLNADNIYLLMLAVTVSGALEGVLTPCQRAYLGDVFSKNRAKEANSFLQFSEVLAKTCGFMLAGFIVSTFGVSTALLADAVSFICFAGLVFFTKADAKWVNEVATSGPVDRRSSISWFFNDREKVLPSLLFSSAWLATGTMFALEARYAKEYLGASDTMVGVLFGLATVGALFAIRWFRQVKDLKKTLLFSCGFEILLVITYALSSNIWIACCSVIGYGVFLTFRQISISSYFHQTLHSNEYGRAFSVHHSISNLFRLVLMGIAGPVSDLTSVRTTMVTISIVGLVAIGILGIQLMQPRSMNALSSRKLLGS